MGIKSPIHIKILNDTLDIVTLMTHCWNHEFMSGTYVLKINGLNICISRRFFVPLQ